MKRHLVWLLVFIPLLSHGMEGLAEGCAACWAGYGPGDERFNKPLADLRILYEKEGKAALPAIEEALVMDRDHLVKQRAATYIGEIKDPNSIPVLEGMLADLYKKVTFGNFGVGTPDFHTRLKVAHVLVNMGAGDNADRIWSRYDRLDGLKKSEVPYLLNALNDPKLCERLLEILRQGKDHYAMVSALEVLAMGDHAQVLPFLKSKLAEWEGKGSEPSDPDNPESSMVYYSVLRIKGEQTIFQIEERSKGS
ncbi:MAG: HEAT repeat domain-containing protein [candidate division NC10 bacterium]|nr:HEAT repeat domain-containing protein [candidate division NC10 bacterium]